MIIGHIILDTTNGDRIGPSGDCTQQAVDQCNAQVGYVRYRLVPIRQVVVMHLYPTPEA